MGHARSDDDDDFLTELLTCHRSVLWLNNLNHAL
jgi:hypothetical protein